MPQAPIGRNTRQARPTLDVASVGTGVADMLVSRLLDGSRLRLIERSHGSDAPAEFRRTSPSARYVIAGPVTKFGGEQKTKAASVLAMGLLSAFARRPSLIAGAFDLEDTYANGDIACRIVEASSGEIVGAGVGRGQSRRRGLLLGGIGIGPSLGMAGSVRVGSEDFAPTLLGEAIEFAVKEAADRLETTVIRAATGGGEARGG